MGQEIPIRSTVKVDDVNSLIKTSNFETFGLYFSKTIHKISPFDFFLLVWVSKQWLKKFWPPLLIKNVIFVH